LVVRPKADVDEVPPPAIRLVREAVEVVEVEAFAFGVDAADFGEPGEDGDIEALSRGVGVIPPTLEERVGFAVPVRLPSAFR